MGKLSYPSTVGYLRNGRWKANTAETTANVATVMAPARRSWIGRCTALPTGYYVDGCGSFGWWAGVAGGVSIPGGAARLHRVTVLGMTSYGSVPRRSFLAAVAAAPLDLPPDAGKSVQTWIELY